MNTKLNVINQILFWLSLSALTLGQFIPDKDVGLWVVLASLVGMGVWLVISQMELRALRKRTQSMFEELKTNTFWDKMPFTTIPDTQEPGVEVTPLITGSCGPIGTQKDIDDLMDSLNEDNKMLAYTIDTPSHTITYDKPGGKRIKCKTCQMTSYNQNDVKERFCGKCNTFHPKQ